MTAPAPKRSAFAHAVATLESEEAQAFAAHLRRSRRRRDQRKADGPPVQPVLLDRHGMAALFGVSLPQLRRITGASWWPVAPIEISPRCLRWPRAELEAAVAHMPRRATP